jgi:hypothetical protein
MDSFLSSITNPTRPLKSLLDPHWPTARAAMYHVSLLAELAVSIVSMDIYLHENCIKDGYEDIAHVGHDLLMTAMPSNNYYC